MEWQMSNIARYIWAKPYFPYPINMESMGCMRNIVSCKMLIIPLDADLRSKILIAMYAYFSSKFPKNCTKIV